MKIGPFEPKANVPSGSERKGPATWAERATTASANVDLSGVAALKVDPNGEGSFDAAKVARIAAAIREGRLNINAGAIADRLIANAREVLERPAR